MIQHGAMKIRKSIDAKLAIEEYRRRNTKNLMVYVGGVEERQRKKGFLRPQDFLNHFKNKYFGEK